MRAFEVFRRSSMAISIGDSGSQNWRWHITIVGKGANVNVVQRRITSSYKVWKTENDVGIDYVAKEM